MNAEEYLQVAEGIKQQIMLAQQRAVAGANRELVVLYWNIGKIVNEQKTWGDGFIENLARDIRGSFPNIRGFSVRNLKYMSKFARIYKDLEICATPLHNLPWRHNIVLMERLEDEKQRIWYAGQALENGYSETNIKSFRRFYLEFQDIIIGQAVPAQSGNNLQETELAIKQALPAILSWTHYERLMRVANRKARWCHL
jgi:predicted nuclease of restriction endonuclease-like (RecB) superfamily